MADKKRTIIIFIIGLALILAGFFLVRLNEKSYTTNLFAMDTACTITKSDDDFSRIKEKILALEKIISAHDENSEIYKLNETKSLELSDTARKILDESLLLYNEYGKVNLCVGAVTSLWNVEGENPVLPSDEDILSALKTVDAKNISLDGNFCQLENGVQLDFGATGKGFALDEIKELLDDEKCNFCVVSFGSSTLLYGEKPNNKPFTVAISNPDDSNSELCEFETDSGFISTSGGYQRFFTVGGKTYCHIFDESTGKPVESDLSSVTVKCDSGIKSDFLSTCIFIGGTKELEKWLLDDSIEIIAVDKNKNVYCSKSLSNSIQITNENFQLVK